MNFAIDTYDFKKAMEKAYKAIYKGSVLDVLKNVKLHIEGRHSYILGTNLENFVKVNINIQGTSEITDIIFSDTATLLKAMKFFNDSDILFVVEDDKITLSCRGKTTTQELLKENGVSGIPDVNTENAKHYEYNISSLKERFNLIKYAASKTDTRPVMTGIHFNRNDMVALDGYRLALSKADNLIVETAFTAPANSIALAIDVLDENITIVVNNKIVQMSDGKVTVTSRLLDGEFFDYKASIPKDGKEIGVNIAEYKDTLKYFKAFKKSGQKKTEKQKAAWFNSKLILIGTENQSILENVTGSFDAPIGFDLEYMLETMTQFKTDKVNISISSPVSPIVIKNDDSYLVLVLPIRLKPEDAKQCQAA